MMKALVVILTILVGVFPAASQEIQEAQEPIVENVQVNWWQVPVFAVDKTGKPVRDLKPEDIEVLINDYVIPSFDLHGRSFTMETRYTEPAPTQPQAKKPPISRDKVVVLLFDVSMSSALFTQRAKEIAKKIVMAAEENTRLVILTIETQAGLTYIGEGIATLPNKSALLGMIKKKVMEREHSRYVSNPNFAQELFNSKRYVSTWGTGAHEFYKLKSGIFFQALKSLYFYLNSIQDNKFIYFFTEGISDSALESIRGGASMFTYHLEETAKSLGRCGAVLFLINSMGVDQYSSSFTTDLDTAEALDSKNPLSGETSLKYLAKISGGTYMEGVTDQIVERIENMYQSYYEISFPDIPQLKGGLREVTVTSKRPDIIIYSLSSLEKKRNYTDMEAVEKDMLVLQLITVNPLAESKMEAYNARIDKTDEGKKEVVYHIQLPPSYINKTIDVYKFWVLNQQEVTHAEKESMVPKEGKLSLRFKMDLPKSAGKETGTGELKTYFVLVDGTANTARVHAMDMYDDDPELPELAQEQETTGPKKSGEIINNEDMNKLLQGAADYCERLKNSAFHFYCQERIVETRKPITDADLNSPEINEELMRKGVVRALDEIRNKAYTQVKKYIFGYRLLKQGNKINEERKWIYSEDNVKIDREQVVQTNAFFSEKAIFAPITLLDRSRQDLYNYQFLGFDGYKGRQVAVLDIAPKNPGKTPGIYGKVWIDREDFSVLRIDANPHSILGYEKLNQLAKKLRTKLYLTLESEFDALRDGIRFPTKVSMLEKYKGGRIISEYRAGDIGWERTRAEFIYEDYRFFDVQTEVTVQK